MKDTNFGFQSFALPARGQQAKTYGYFMIATSMIQMILFKNPAFKILYICPGDGEKLCYHLMKSVQEKISC